MENLDEKFIKKLDSLGVDAEKINATTQEIANSIVDFVFNAIDCIDSLDNCYEINKMPNENIGGVAEGGSIHVTPDLGLRITLLYVGWWNQPNYVKKEYYNKVVLDKMLEKYNITVEYVYDSPHNYGNIEITYKSKVKIDCNGITIPNLEETKEKQKAKIKK